MSSGTHEHAGVVQPSDGILLEARGAQHTEDQSILIWTRGITTGTRHIKGQGREALRYNNKETTTENMASYETSTAASIFPQAHCAW